MKHTVIVDIDGTISKVGDRLKYLEQDPPDWDSFYENCQEDEPIEPIVKLVRMLALNYEIVFCTGRRESVRSKTLSWIFENLGDYLAARPVLMRKDGDFRHDTIIKPELLEEADIDLDDIEFVLEDRNSMVIEWRDMGLTCLQVADGDF